MLNALHAGINNDCRHEINIIIKSACVQITRCNLGLSRGVCAGVLYSEDWTRQARRRSVNKTTQCDVYYINKVFGVSSYCRSRLTKCQSAYVIRSGTYFTVNLLAFFF